MELVSSLKTTDGRVCVGVQVKYFTYLHVKNTTFLNNTGEYEAAIRVYNAHLNIKSSNIISNKETRRIIWIGVDSMATRESSEFKKMMMGIFFQITLFVDLRMGKSSFRIIILVIYIKYIYSRIWRRDPLSKELKDFYENPDKYNQTEAKDLYLERNSGQIASKLLQT